MKTYFSAAMIVVVLVLAGCTPPTKTIDTTNDEGKAVMGLDYRDFDKAAVEMVQSMIASGVFKKPDGSRYVVTTATVLNDTMQRIDTEQLTFKIEQELMNSGMVTMSSAVGGRGAVETGGTGGGKRGPDGAPDQMVHQMRELRDSEKADEFKPGTLPGKGQILAPELSISGKILQRNVPYDNNLQQVEYYFQLRVSELASGTTYWQKETLIGKRGSKKVAPW
ncbi:MAG: penicillin-binding protein activator LpoB [Planctomycetes bacterium]|nr:penicillin-binding protein activator LpoB [Planctomycetota bacterium]